MPDDFGDARLEELEFLSMLNREAGYNVGDEILNPGPRRDMIALLVREGYVNDLNIAWRHQSIGNVLAYLKDLKDQLDRERWNTLSSILGGQPTNVQISHRGRVRLSELKQQLQSNRIREGFGILWDKRHVDTDLRIALMQASGERPLSVAFMDMNGLKAINDTFGHDAGDAAIKAYFQTAEALLGVHGDVFCKGGDEVVAILSNCDRDTAQTALKDLCLALKDEQLRVGSGDPLKLTISIGLATTTVPSMGPTALLSQADEAMYRGKEVGKGHNPRPSSVAVYEDTQVELI